MGKFKNEEQRKAVMAKLHPGSGSGRRSGTSGYDGYEGREKEYEKYVIINNPKNFKRQAVVFRDKSGGDIYGATKQKDGSWYAWSIYGEPSKSFSTKEEAVAYCKSNINKRHEKSEEKRLIETGSGSEGSVYSIASGDKIIGEMKLRKTKERMNGIPIWELTRSDDSKKRFVSKRKPTRQWVENEI